MPQEVHDVHRPRLIRERAWFWRITIENIGEGGLPYCS